MRMRPPPYQPFPPRSRTSGRYPGSPQSPGSPGSSVWRVRRRLAEAEGAFVGSWVWGRGAAGRGRSGQFPFFFLLVSSPVSSTCAQFLLRRLSPSMAAPAGSRCMRSLYQKWVCLLLGCGLRWASCFEVEHVIDSPHPRPPEGESGEELLGGKTAGAPGCRGRVGVEEAAVAHSVFLHAHTGVLGSPGAGVFPDRGVRRASWRRLLWPPEGGRRHKGRGGCL